MRDQWTFGEFRVDFSRGWIEPRLGLSTLGLGDVAVSSRQHPDPRLMQVLRVLIDHAGETVSAEEILANAWSDRVVSRDSVTTAVYQLRQLLGDSAESPRYIASEPRRGYRWIATTAPARPKGRVVGVAALLAALVVCTLSLMPTDDTPYLYVSPMKNFDESPVQEPLFSAIESTFLSELIQTNPGRIRTDDGDDVALRLESMMVACDLGPTLVMRLMDTREGIYVWSNAYNLDEVAADPNPPTLVERAARDVSEAIL